MFFSIYLIIQQTTTTIPLFKQKIKKAIQQKLKTKNQKKKLSAIRIHVARFPRKKSSALSFLACVQTACTFV